MNNKGFAVTAVIYGLSILGVLIISILMGTLSASRANIQLEANKIEKDLIAFNRTSVVYNEGENLFTVPQGESGWYRVEAFGTGYANLPGAYTTGIIYLDEGRSLYVDLSYRPSNADAIIRAEDGSGPIIMRAAAADGAVPGGTLQAYSAEPLGGNVLLTDFQLRNPQSSNLIGTEGIYYSNYGPTSLIAGYPGSERAKSYGGFNYYFVDGLMLAAANKGVSKVIITRLARKDDEIPTIPRKTDKYDDVVTVRVYNYSNVRIMGLFATANGNQYGANFAGESGTISIDLPGVNVDDISVLFDTSSNSFVKNVDIVLVHSDGGTVSIYSSSQNDASGFTATPTGIKLSAYQPDYSMEPPDYGNYYLIPVLSDNKVVSARRNTESEDNPIQIEYIQGTPRQKWAITKIKSNNVLENPDDIEYYISEESRYKSISIYHDQNVVKSRIVAAMTFNTLSRNPPQIWKITPQYDGTYAIKTTIASYNMAQRSGFISVNTSRKEDDSPSDYYDQLMLGQALNYNVESDEDTVPTVTERFHLYSIDFGNVRN